MQGDFSRWTFDARARFRSVLLQQGRVLLDADWNEQAQITAHHDEARARDAFGHSGVPMEVRDSFRITDTAGDPPLDTPWGELRITGGRMYVDGVLAEAAEPEGGITLGDQPDLPGIRMDDPELKDPGLDEPGDGRYAFYLDVSTHHVTMDEAPELRETALGGPDTTTRARTVWQVRHAPVFSETTTCRELNRPGWNWKSLERGTMTASLKAGTANGDPCALTAEARYTRLENQLYRVQIHKKGTDFLWSRENGSVTGALREIGTVGVPTEADAVLTVDREGRDESLSIRHGDIVEVTSTALQLRRESGYLAKAVHPEGRRIPVTWLNGPGIDHVKRLGRAPIVRRWESEPHPVSATTPTDLEGGICVQFADLTKLQTGDYWLITARSARLGYGLAADPGTLLPMGLENPSTALAPHGPQRRIAPLAILARKTTDGVATWTMESDCRRIAPSLTRLTTLDLVGGDGQEALPGEELEAAIRVVVRNGEEPVVGAPVHFRPIGGTIRTEGSATPHPLDKPVYTRDDGVAKVWWTLDTNGPSAQTLEARRLDSAGDGTDVKVVVTGRMSRAQDIAWTPKAGCEAFKDTKTVQKALEGLVSTRELRLLGGDGQYLPAGTKVLPRRIRVIADSACGPVAGATVWATTTAGAQVQWAKPDEPVRPDALTSGLSSVPALTETDGSASFWWQPMFSGDTAAALTVQLENDTVRAPIVVTAQPEVSFAYREGMHITDLYFTGAPDKKFMNDHGTDVALLKGGITVQLDKAVNRGCLRYPLHLTGEVLYKPVVRVVLEVPFPEFIDKRYSTEVSDRFGSQSVTLSAVLDAEGGKLPGNRTSGPSHGSIRTSTNTRSTSG